MPVALYSGKNLKLQPQQGGAMRDVTEANLTEAVLGKLAGAADPRFQQVMTSLFRHLHTFVREVGLTEAGRFAGATHLILEEYLTNSYQHQNPAQHGRELNVSLSSASVNNAAR